MGLFDLEYIDKKDNILDIDAKNKDGKPILNDGKGTWEFKHRILAPLILAFILPFKLILHIIPR